MPFLHNPMNANPHLHLPKMRLQCLLERRRQIMCQALLIPVGVAFRNLGHQYPPPHAVALHIHVPESALNSHHQSERNFLHRRHFKDDSVSPKAGAGRAVVGRTSALPAPISDGRHLADLALAPRWGVQSLRGARPIKPQIGSIRQPVERSSARRGLRTSLGGNANEGDVLVLMFNQAIGPADVRIRPRWSARRQP